MVDVHPALRLPKGIPTSRYRPPAPVEIPKGLQELPLIDKDTPDSGKVQEHWIARVGVFDLCDDTQREAYERIWQSVCDGQAIMSEHRTEYDSAKCRFLALLRWADIKYKVPDEPRG
jgi:hypothetical protein